MAKIHYIYSHSNYELFMDLWLCVGVYGPMSLHWLPWDALLVKLVIR